MDFSDEFPPEIPIQLKRTYVKHGIKCLFRWQAECLADKRLYKPIFDNLIYSAPTSAGKTLIAEVLAACNILKTNRKVLFILPYISSAREKLISLQSLWRPLNIVVKAFIGASSAGINGWSAAVCTIEKATALINAMIESELMEEIGAIVIDEVHMLFDGERGANLENLIAKILFLRKEKGFNIQIIGMSATLSDHEPLVDWLGARFFTSQYRPLELRQFVFMDDDQIFEIDGETKIRTLESKFIVKGDSKRLIGISIEALIRHQSILIFCATKAEVEQNAILLAKYIKYCIERGQSNRFTELNNLFSRVTSRDIDYFQKKTLCTETDLLHCIEFGVAYHHAGLTVEEREQIEALFRLGSIKILISTSTLSSGVNLPAHRVIIRTTATTPIPLTYVSYNQMVGRAGRQGLTDASFGESYLVCSHSDWPIVQRQIQRKPFAKPIRSLTRLFLEAINSSLVSSVAQLQTLAHCTVSIWNKPIDIVLNELIDLGLVVFGEDAEGQQHHNRQINLEGNTIVRPTQFGRAILASAFDLHTALRVFEGLQTAMESVCLDSELHMLFLVTPINNLAINENAIDWNFYHQKWTQLQPDLSRVAKRVGISEEFFMQKMAGKALPHDCPNLNVHIRFLASLILFELINEKAITGVARYWRINRGLLQALQQQAATYAYMVVSFCDRLGWIYLRTLLDGFAERLQFGVRRDLTELVRISGIDAIRARAFHQHGIDSISALANCSIDKIRLILRKAVPYIGAQSGVKELKGKNCWLHGETHMTEGKAVHLLLDRAVAALKEQIKTFSLPQSRADLSLRFDSSCLNIVDDIEGDEEERDDLSTIEESWISEDLSESVGELCETLSPIRLEEKNEMDGQSKIIHGDKQIRIFETPNPKWNQNGLKKSWTNRISKMEGFSSPLAKKKILFPTKNINDLVRNIEAVCSCWGMEKFEQLTVCGLEWADGGTLILASAPTNFYSFSLASSKCSICFDSLSIFLKILANPSIVKWLSDALEFWRKLRPYLVGTKIVAESIFCFKTLDALLSCEAADEDENQFDAVHQRNICIRAELKKWSLSVPIWVCNLLEQTELGKLANTALNAFLLYYGGQQLSNGQDIKRRELCSIYMGSLLVVIEMEFNGIHMERRKAMKMLELLQEKMASLEQEIFDLSEERFVLESAAEVSKILFVKLQLKLPEHIVANKLRPRRRRHLPTSSAVLKQIDHPICEKIVHWRQLGHSSKVLHGLLSTLSAKHSRINANFDNVGTSSGRIVCYSPNLQFIPKQTLLGKYSIRSLFTASKGNVLIAADYCQIELRVLCQLSEDSHLIDLLNNPKKDPFDEISELFSHERDAYVISRTKAKQLCYAIIYGMGAENLSKELRLNTVEEAQNLINHFFKIFPGVKCWMESVVEAVRGGAKCETFFGRTKAFRSDPKDAKAIERRSVNFIIQGTASEIFRKALIDINQRLKKLSSNALLVLPIHDEVIVEVDEGTAKECAKQIKQGMEGVCPQFHIGLPVKVSMGADWGSLAEIGQFIV